MSLTLVPRSVKALSDHINGYYRVLKGSEQDSIFLRLASLGGSFEVRHSATNAPVFKVTDAGVQGIIQGGDIVDGTIDTPELKDGAVTSAKILDGTIVNDDVNAAAAIALTKVAHVGAGSVLRSNGTANVGGQIVAGDISTGAVTSTQILDDTILNADVNSAAGIVVTKLAHVGANNVLRSTGTANVGGQVVNNDVSNSANIALAKLAPVTANQIVKDVGSGVPGGGLLVDANVAAAGTANIALAKLIHVGANSVLRSNGSANVGGPLVNADVDAAAAIAVTKVAHVGANNVLKSNGTANVGGQIVNADIATGANIDGAKLADLSIPSSKLITGAPISPGSVGTAELAANAATQSITGTGATAGPTTSSASLGLLTDMNIAMTTTGGPVLMLFSGVFFTSAGGMVTIAPYVDNAALGLTRYQTIPASTYVTMSFAHLYTPTAASHAFQVYWAVNSGSATADSTQRRLVAIELKR